MTPVPVSGHLVLACFPTNKITPHITILYGIHKFIHNKSHAIILLLIVNMYQCQIALQTMCF